MTKTSLNLFGIILPSVIGIYITLWPKHDNIRIFIPTFVAYRLIAWRIRCKVLTVRKAGDVRRCTGPFIFETQSCLCTIDGECYVVVAHIHSGLQHFHSWTPDNRIDCHLLDNQSCNGAEILANKTGTFFRTFQGGYFSISNLNVSVCQLWYWCMLVAKVDNRLGTASVSKSA